MPWIGECVAASGSRVTTTLFSSSKGRSGCLYGCFMGKSGWEKMTGERNGANDTTNSHCPPHCAGW